MPPGIDLVVTGRWRGAALVQRLLVDNPLATLLDLGHTLGPGAALPAVEACRAAIREALSRGARQRKT
jgi:hypothetical protein